MNLALSIVTAAVAILSLAISVIALQRTRTDARLAVETAHRDATLDRLVAGPVPHISIVAEPRHEAGHILKIVVQNRGRTAATMVGGGLAFDLPDGANRHITIAYNREVRVDPEGAPRTYVLTAPILKNVLDEAAERSEIRPFVLLGTNTLYADLPLDRALLEMAIDNAPPAPNQTFAVFDVFDDYLRDRELRADASGRHYEITDGMYRAFIEVARQNRDDDPSRGRKR